MTRPIPPVPAAAAALVVLCAALPFLEGCVPMIIAGGAQVAVSAGDPRSTGAQIDDQTIEIKVTTEAGGRWGNEVHLNVTSYNGIVLLTGEAPSTIIQDEITKIAKSTDRVRIVQNEMVIGPATDLGARTNDTYITGLVKTRLLQEEKLKALYIKVVTERSVVYLMGIMPREQADLAAQVAATTAGVAKVVKVVEYKP
ncbi:MAG: BON domain-containing protein [Casimicrobiaceae bacterium]